MSSFFTSDWRRGLLAAVLPLAMALALPIASSAHADTVTDWNAIMQATVSVPPTNPVFQTRWGAITQLAVFEAVNAIEGDYEPYLGVIVAPAGASPDAAAIAAAHLTLVTLRPGSAVALDAARAASLAAIPDGPAKDDGIAVGEAAALAMLGAGLAAEWRPVPRGLAGLGIFGVTYGALTLALRHPDALRSWQSLTGSRAS